MEVLIEINCEHAAFEDNPQEIDNVLHQAARKIKQIADGGGAGDEMKLLDVNGNTCGSVTVVLK